MADLTAIALRVKAREAMIKSGGRGFMRFAPQGKMLLITDAPRREQDAGVQLADVLRAEGFACTLEDGMLSLAPQDELVLALVRDIALQEICWQSQLHPAQALALRWAGQAQLPLTENGRQLITDTLRLTGQPGICVMDGLAALRAHTAVMLRAGDRSGMYEAGRILMQWCEKEECV